MNQIDLDDLTKNPDKWRKVRNFFLIMLLPSIFLGLVKDLICFLMIKELQNNQVFLTQAIITIGTVLVLLLISLISHIKFKRLLKKLKIK
ncbi:MAG: hypothetical protein ACFE91_13395 [Promethearchaeota archaeon]